MPDTAKYLPAVRLAKRGKGIPRNFSRAERQKRRERIIALNKKRSKKGKENNMSEDTTPDPAPPPAPDPQPQPPTPQ